MRITFLFFFLFLTICASWAQQLSFDPKIEFFSFPNSEFNSEEITDIQVDKHGYVWIISFSAIYRYNGREFDKIDSRKVAHGSFLRFQEDIFNRKYVIDYYGNIFFIINGGLESYEYNDELVTLNKTKKVIDYTFQKDSSLHCSFINSKRYQISQNGIQILAESEFIKNAGFTYLFGKNKRQMLIQNKENYLSHLSTLTLLDSNFQQIDTIRFERRNYLTLPISIVELGNGNILLSPGGNSLLEFNIHGFVKKIELPFGVTRLFRDKSGVVWVSSYPQGVYTLNIDKDYALEKVHKYKTGQSFVSSQDYQGGIWSFSEFGGLGYISNSNVEYIKPSISNELAISFQDSIVTYCYNKKVEQINLNHTEIINSYDLDSVSNVRSVVFDKTQNILWLASRGKIVNINSSKEKVFELFNTEKWGAGSKFDVIQLLNDEQNGVLVKSSKRYFFINLNGIYYTSSALESDILDVLSFNSEIWINTSEGIFVDKNNERKYLGDEYGPAQFSAKSMKSWGSDIIISIGNQGVFKYKNEKLIELKYKSKSLLDCYLAVENDSLIWAISTEGCFSISKVGEELKVALYNRLPNDKYKKIQSNGKLLMFSTSKGELGRISFDQIRENKLNPPNLLIESIETEDSIYRTDYPNTITLEYDQRSFAISYQTIDFQNLGCMYRYKVEGLDSTWFSTKSTSVSFASLPAGEYNFLVKSKFGMGEWSETKGIKIQIKKPFWQEWWFVLGGALTTLLLLYFIYKIRIEQVAKEQKLNVNRLKSEQKALRAQMSPHYIFNIIASLKYLLIQEKTKKANEFLDLFSSSIRNLLDQSNSSCISIRKEVKFLNEYIELEKFRTEDSFDFLIDLDNKELQAQIPTFIIQPFVENSIKHGLKNVKKDAILKISFKRMDSGYLNVTVEDNGIGREASNPRMNKRHSHGIRLIRERLRIHNKMSDNVMIEDLVDAEGKALGTKVTIVIRTISTSELEEEKEREEI